MAATSPPWGVTADEVQAHIPSVRLSNTSEPSLAQVAAWITDFGAEVAIGIHGYDDLPDDKIALVETFAARLVGLGAGARAANAAYLENTGRTSSPYQIIREEYVSGLASLKAAVGEMLLAQASTGDPDSPGAGDGGAVSTLVAWSSPAPRVLDGNRWGW